MNVEERVCGYLQTCVERGCGGSTEMGQYVTSHLDDTSPDFPLFTSPEQNGKVEQSSAPPFARESITRQKIS